MTTPKRISVRFPLQEYNQLKHEAKRQRVSMAELLRRAWTWYYAQRRKVRLTDLDFGPKPRITKAVSEGTDKIKTGRYEH